MGGESVSASHMRLECLKLLWYETEGHPGALKLILDLMESQGPKVTQHQAQHDGQPGIHYDATWCRSILNDGLLAGLPLNARGYWNKFAREKFAAEDLSLLQKEKSSLGSRSTT
ncbi:hypothetical protein XANCAGTX0491_000397 [Xanthoria calcicola]